MRSSYPLSVVPTMKPAVASVMSLDWPIQKRKKCNDVDFGVQTARYHILIISLQPRTAPSPIFQKERPVKGRARIDDVLQCQMPFLLIGHMMESWVRRWRFGGSWCAIVPLVSSKAPGIGRLPCPFFFIDERLFLHTYETLEDPLVMVCLGTDCSASSWVANARAWARSSELRHILFISFH